MESQGYITTQLYAVLLCVNLLVRIKYITSTPTKRNDDRREWSFIPSLFGLYRFSCFDLIILFFFVFHLFLISDGFCYFENNKTKKKKKKNSPDDLFSSSSSIQFVG